MPDHGLHTLLACPLDHTALTLDDGAQCADGHGFDRGSHGYLELARPGSPVLTIASTSGDCAHIQEAGGERVYREYLAPWLQGLDGAAAGATRPQTLAVLDAGCGLGVAAAAAARDGHRSVGVDMRAVADRWAEAGRPPDQFVVGAVTELPFADGAFDVAMALGVIEHVGTSTGHLSLAGDWREQRRRFAGELLRVVRPGGRVLMACPNKTFPIDIQHGPTDELTHPPRRAKIFEKYGVNIHPTWGAYHLPSYRDVHRWFGRRRVRALPLKGYFGFSALDRPGVPSSVARAARWWIEDMPSWLRKTPFNPYVLVEITV